MKCQEVKQKIFTYLDGFLSNQVQSEFMSHLSHCDSCQKELEYAREINQLLTNSCTAVQPPADFVSQVMNRIDELEKNSVSAKPNVVPLQEQRSKKKNILESLAASGFRFSKVASFAALVAAISAFIAFANIPEMTKMADLGHKFSESPLLEIGDKPNQAVTPGQNKDDKEPGEKPPGQKAEPTDNKPEQQEPGAEQGNLPEQVEPGEAKPEESNEANSPTPPKPGTTAEPLKSEEEVVPNLPRLDGPFRQVTGITSVVAKSVSLTPISTDSNYLSFKPAWDERGKKIYYFSTQEASEGNYTLWAKGINDQTAELVAKNVTKNVNADKPGSKSPDGKYKLYQDQGQVFVSKTDGSEAVPVTPKLEGAHFTYAWKPDGKSVAISVKGSESQGLWLADAGGSGWSLITASGGGTSLSWSPDGKKLAFTGINNMIYVGVLVAENKTNLLMVVPEGDNQGDVTLAWSPDSQKLLFDWAGSGSSRGVYLATIPE